MAVVRFYGGFRMETNVSSATMLFCTECGKSLPVDELIRHGNAYVCASCKPIFLQRLAEGVRIPSVSLPFAGFWIRFGAVLLDGIVLWIVNMSFAVLVGLNFSQALGIEARPNGALIVALFAFQLGVPFLYEVLMIGAYGATLGKMACHLRVVRPDGTAVSYLQALGRYFGKLLNYFTIFIGFIIAGFDQEKRALHDRICNTRVIRT
jgi:uncharacterized RDD family membrane protein YckC